MIGFYIVVDILSFTLDTTEKDKFPKTVRDFIDGFPFNSSALYRLPDN